MTAKPMEEVLLEIHRLKGLDGLSNGRALVSLFSDLSSDKKYLRLVRYLVESGCHTDLLGARELSPAMQQARLQQTIKKLCTETLISEEASRQVCTAFWNVLYGSVPIQKTNKENYSEGIQKSVRPVNTQEQQKTQPAIPDRVPSVLTKTESTPKNEKPKFKPGLIAAALAVILMAIFLPGFIKKELFTNITLQKQTNQNNLEQISQETVAQKTGVPGQLREDPMEYIRDENGRVATFPVFGTDIMRDQVGTITFLSTLDAAPEKVYDLSALGDSSVLGWAIMNGELYDLYIAAEGGVKAPENCHRMFACYKDVWSINFNNSFDTSDTTNMSGMFEKSNIISRIDLQGFRTFKVTDMSGMFNGCGLLTQLDVSGFDTSNVTNMDNMFYGCTFLTELNLSSFDTSCVTSMNNIFAACGLLEKLDLSSFNTENVTSMNGMFAFCDSLVAIDVSSFNTENVQDMGSMFQSCSKLKEINLQNFHTPSLINMSYMFDKCEALAKLDLSNFDTASVTKMSYVFTDCNKLRTLSIPNFDISNVTSYRHFMNDGAKINGRPWETFFAN